MMYYHNDAQYDTPLGIEWKVIDDVNVETVLMTMSVNAFVKGEPDHRHFVVPAKCSVV